MAANGRAATRSTMIAAIVRFIAITLAVGLGTAVVAFAIAGPVAVVGARYAFKCGVFDTSQYSFWFGTADCIVDSIYQNVADPLDGEMPSVVTSYVSAPHVVGIVGGRGEGLNCSLPATVSAIFFDRPREADEHVNQRFRQACVFHDMCYRHGLATYGYTQNTCDRILQEQAFRICMARFGDSRGCQLDAKRFLLGVSAMGGKSFLGWEHSTYYEFDPSPSRSNRFYTARVVDHPFRVAAPAPNQMNDPQQFLLNFEIKRSGVAVKCENCPDRKFDLEELRSAGIDTGSLSELSDQSKKSRIAQKAGRELRTIMSLNLGAQRAVWLPHLRIHSAPFLVQGERGQQYLVWLNRRVDENTTVCIVKAEPKKLLIHSRPSWSGCDSANSERLELATADLFASSPQPLIIRATGPGKAGPIWDVVAQGLTMQRDKEKNLHMCLYSLLHKKKDQCVKLIIDGTAAPNVFGAFQHGVHLQEDRAFYFIRRVHEMQHLKLLSLNLNYPFDGGAPRVTVHSQREATVADDFDPLVPMAANKDRMRFVSVRADADRLRLYEFDFARDELYRFIPIDWSADRKDLFLHSSWARRPTLVVSRTVKGETRTQFILSRGRLVNSPHVPSGGGRRDSARLEFLLLEQDKEPAADETHALRFVGGTACVIDYTFAENYRDDCSRSLRHPAGPLRASPARKLLSAQMLVGHFRSVADSNYDLALVDLCRRGDPVILRPEPLGDTITYSPWRARAETRTTPRRHIRCEPLTAKSAIHSDMH